MIVLTGRVPPAMEYNYIVTDASGAVVLRSLESCRYSRQLEAAMLEAGYTIRLNGKPITKTDIRKRGSK